MKKFLVYLCVAIIVVACGVSIYYVVRNDENIYSTVGEEMVYMNKGEVIDIPVIHERPYRKTTLTVESTSESITVNAEDWTLTANQPGTAMITVVSSNKNFGPFEFTVSVGNGSVDYPYYIRNEADLRQVGKDTWTVADNYQLVADINLTEEFSPIGSSETSFTGTFSGSEEMYAINNLVINGSEGEYKVGLFTSIGETGRVENLVVNNAKVTSNDADFTGIIAGKNKGVIGKVIIKNSSVESSNQSNCFTGVIAGDNYTSSSYAEISLCTVENTSIKMASVGGGIAGRNYGGAITNNHISLSDVSYFESENTNKIFGGIAGFTRDGGDGYYSRTGNYTQSVVANNIILFNRIDQTNGEVAGIFGKLIANSIKSRGAYSMLVFSTSYTIPGWITNINDSPLSSSNATASNFVLSASKNELYKNATYSTPKGSTFDLKTTWSLTEDADLHINYNNKNLDYQILPAECEVFEITDNASLKTAINYMRAYPTTSTTFLIKGTYSTSEETDGETGKTKTIESGVYTYKCEDNWIPIGTKDNPFRGKIIAEKDAIIQIKNLNVADKDYAGFFGYINGAEINNVRIVAAEVSGTAAGAITGFNVNGTINNCTVMNSNISGSKYSGAVAGYSSGVISKSISTSCTITVAEEKTSNIYIGGIAGKAKGKVIDCTSDYFTSSVTFESDKNMVFIGGAIGYTDDAYVEGVAIIGLAGDSSKYKGSTMVGGVAGYALNSEIRNCSVVDSMQLKSNQKNSYSIVGGIIGVSSNSKLLRSSVGKIIVIGYNVGGLVSYNAGSIEECYSGIDAYIEGKYVGGLTCHNAGSIKNSYSICQLKGEEKEAGLTVYLLKNSSIDYCYTYCLYSGEAKEAYAETASNYKSVPKGYGTITNTVIVGTENSDLVVYTIKDFFSIRYITCRGNTAKVGVQVEDVPTIKIQCNLCSENALIGQEDMYAMFNNLGFDEEIWNFSNECIGNSPVLKYVKDSGCGVVAQASEETEEPEAEEVA